MSEAQAELFASIEVLAVWVAISVFITLYAWWSPGWRDTPVGKMLMGLAGSMWVLVTLALTGRWFPFADEIFQYLALATYALILFSWVWAVVVLVLLRKGVITPSRMDPHPVRDWLRSRFQRNHPK